MEALQGPADRKTTTRGAAQSRKPLSGCEKVGAGRADVTGWPARRRLTGLAAKRRAASRWCTHCDVTAAKPRLSLGEAPPQPAQHQVFSPAVASIPAQWEGEMDSGTAAQRGTARRNDADKGPTRWKV